MKLETAKEPIIKAVCAIFDKDGLRILFQFDRRNKKVLRFPDGKIRPGETSQECIKRELTREEYNLEITKISPWIFCENFFNYENNFKHEILIIQTANLVNPKIGFPLKYKENSDISRLFAGNLQIIRI